jgi:hypothetical protein
MPGLIRSPKMAKISATSRPETLIRSISCGRFMGINMAASSSPGLMLKFPEAHLWLMSIMS